MTAFTHKRVFIANKFPLRDDLFELIQRGIIEEQHKTKLACYNLSERGDRLIDCLLQEKDVAAFENFMKLCEENDTMLADNLRQEIASQRQEVGLPPVGKIIDNIDY